MATKCPKCHLENPDTAKFCSECATPLQSSTDISVTKTLETPIKGLAAGSTFAGRYQIIEELGKGGMGAVYKALDTQINEEVAIKLIRPEIAADEKTLERFSNELKLARKISHKNVCRMFHLEKGEETPYISMEYLEGKDLKKIIWEKEKLPVEEAIGIAQQVCEGLVEAHRLGVVHRDLKPQNIMIDKEGQAKIMDFGIARSVEAPGVTQTGVIIGTPDYISPEQAEGKEADQRSDIYSLGVILYEMVTGSVPFKGDTAFSVALKHKSQLPQDPRKLNPDISVDLSRLILVCMEKDRKRRYQTAKDLLADLTNIEDGFPLGTKIQPKRPTFVSALIQKRIIIPALAVALVVILVAVWQIFIQKGTGSIPSGKPSIAVLPFDDLSLLQDQEIRCEGLADTLISALSQIDNLYIPARTSAFSFKRKEKNYQEIGRSLGVNFVLEGGIQKQGNTLRITTRIIKILDESQIWAQTYTDIEKNIFDIQDQISLEIIDKLEVELLAGEELQLVKRYTENSEAYNLYLKGRYFWNRRTGEDLKKAKECFEQAIEIDPNYAMAYSGVADCFFLLPQYSPFPPEEASPKAKEAVLKALEIDNTLAEAHASLAMIKIQTDYDWEGAEKEFKRAIELKHGYATAHHFYAFRLMWMGRHEESITEIKMARELDPLSLIINANVGSILFYARRYDEAIEQYRNSLEMYPDFDELHRYIGMAYVQKGMHEQAIKEFKEAISISGGFSLHVAGLGHAYAMAGKRREAMNIVEELKELSKREYVSMYQIAAIYTALSEKDQAFECLEKAYKGFDPKRLYLKIDPRFDNLHPDPRYKALLQNMGLE